MSLVFDPAVEVESISEGEEVTVTLAAPLRGGERITADLLVEDEGRNTLNVLVPFRARNDRMPKLLLTELRTEQSKSGTEFVEFFTQSAGNLGALRLFIAGYSLTSPVYEFPPTEVQAGKYIVLHLRTPEEGWLDETGDDLSLSAGKDACPEARDFWIGSNTELFRKTDAVFFMDQDDNIIDAVLLSENADPSWSKPYAAAAAELLATRGAWLPPGDAGDSGGGTGWVPAPEDAVISGGTTVTRTICRDEAVSDNNSAADWYITATSNATPGKKNSVKQYQPK
jgi:hypothetical protein